MPSDGGAFTARPCRVGGVALYISCLAALSLLPFVDNLLTQTLSGFKPEFLTLFVPATLVLLLGVYDDLRGTNAVVKFVSLGLIATLFYVMGGRIDALSIPLVGSVQLPAVASFVITVVWLVGITNAFNLIDGLDGLASGAALFFVARDSRRFGLAGTNVDDRGVAGVVRRARGIPSLQLQPRFDLPRRLRRTVHRFSARGVVGVGNSESHDGGDRRADSRVWFSGRRYGDDDGPANDQPEACVPGRQRTHTSHAVGARLVATPCGARALRRLRCLV